MDGYRHELKYYISGGEALLLSRRLSLLLDCDPNSARGNAVSAPGEYFIRSLYFDDIDDAAFCDKLDGVDSRDKYRVRMYDMNSRLIKLERKHKQGQGYIRKDSLIISREECEALMRGYGCGFLLTGSPLRRGKEAFARELYTLLAGGRYVPRVIVDYVREPYIFPVEGVRVTIDRDIRTGFHATNMFDRYLPTFPVLEDGMAVLEVKFNQYLPEYIRMLIQTGASVRSAVSKYVLCRTFEL